MTTTDQSKEAALDGSPSNPPNAANEQQSDPFGKGGDRVGPILFSHTQRTIGGETWQ